MGKRPNPFVNEQIPPPSFSKRAKPGKKPILVSPPMQRALIRVFNRTNASFEAIANAFQDTRDGLSKQWLRKFYKETTNTSHFCELRVSNIPEASKRQEQEQLASLRLTSQPPANDEYDHPQQDLAGEAPQPGVKQQSLGATDSDLDPATVWLRDFINLEQCDTTPDDVWAANRDNPSNGSRGRTCTFATVDSGELLETIPLQGPPAPRRTVTFQDPETSTLSSVRPVKYDNPSLNSLRRREGNQNDRSPPGYAEKSRLAGNMSSTSLASKLGRLTSKPTLLWGVCRRFSIRAESCRSRRSSTGSTARTSITSTGVFKASEYREYYHDPQIENQYGEKQQMRDGRLEDSAFRSITPVQFLMSTRYMLEEDIVDVLRCQLSTIPCANSKLWTMVRDPRGVTALHLAVAFGMISVCSLLIQHGADLKAKTYEGTSISCFARDAERSTSDADMALYWRINHCREWVRLGRNPPVPRPDTPAKSKRQNRNFAPPVDLETTIPRSTRLAPPAPVGTDAIDFAHSRSPYHHQAIRSSTMGMCHRTQPLGGNSSDDRFGCECGECGQPTRGAQLPTSQSTPNLPEYSRPPPSYQADSVETMTDSALFSILPMGAYSQAPSMAVGDQRDMTLPSSIVQHTIFSEGDSQFVESPRASTVFGPLSLLPESTHSVPTHNQPYEYQTFRHPYPAPYMPAHPIIQPPSFLPDLNGLDQLAGSLRRDELMAPQQAMSVGTLYPWGGQEASNVTGAGVGPVWESCVHGEPVSYE